MLNRRDFIRATGMSLAATSISTLAGASGKKKEPGKNKLVSRLGIASFSMREFPLGEMLDMTVRCGIERIAIKDLHLPLDSPKDKIEEAVEMCRQRGIEPYGVGVIYMKSKEAVDQAFEYAKTARVDMIIGKPSIGLLTYVEEKVKQYDIKLAIHNHGPGDKSYPSAASAYKLIKNMDKRMGLCIDIGHTKRINRAPEKDLKDFFDRVFDIHIKDVTAASAEGVNCIIGHGVIDFPAFLKEVERMDYKGTLALEFEADSKDPLPGMMESLGYVKGILSVI
ncbi:MAG: sugar phosphate isomerase/epimerase family protein [Bacteroidales bacterium]